MEDIKLSIQKNMGLLKTQEGKDEVDSEISTLFQMIFNYYMESKQLEIISLRLKQNYRMYPSATSIIQRYRLLGKCGAEDFKKHVIVKIPNGDPKLSRFGVGILHENETLAYQKILPFLDQKIFNRPLPIPEVYFASDNIMVMEDLRKSKYYIPSNRHKVLTTYECRLIIRALAMFHARSMVCKIEKTEEFKNLCRSTKEVMLFSKQSPILDYMDHFLKKLIDVFEKKPYLTGEAENAIKSLHSLRENFREELKDLILYHDEFSVFCHGDVRASNIFLDAKLDIKFIDFQQICYSSVARDLVTLFYVNADPHDMERFLNSFLTTYLEFLHSVIHEHGITLTSTLTHEYLIGQMKKFRVYGIVYGLWHCVEFYIEDKVVPLSIEELCELKCGNLHLEGEFLQRVMDLLAYYEKQNEEEKKLDDQEGEKVISENVEKTKADDEDMEKIAPEEDDKKEDKV